MSCPTVNSYKRLIKTGSMTGFTWAPIFISYGGNNRTHMFRVPMLRPHIEGGRPRSRHVNLSSARWECRAVDPSTNPYLAAAMFLGAGLDGIEQGLDPGEPQLVNMYELSDRELEKRGIRQLPRTLFEAVTAFEAGRSRASRDGRGAVPVLHRSKEVGVVVVPQLDFAMGNRRVSDQVLKPGGALVFWRKKDKDANSEVKIFFASDLHGSNVCFKKFVNSAKFYRADVLVLGGDLTGKAVIPIAEQRTAHFSRSSMASCSRSSGKTELDDFVKRQGNIGFYPAVMSEAEYQRLKADPEAQANLFKTACAWSACMNGSTSPQTS